MFKVWPFLISLGLHADSYRHGIGCNSAIPSTVDEVESFSISYSHTQMSDCDNVIAVEAGEDRKNVTAGNPYCPDNFRSQWL